jgi:hypothetical protein
MTTPAWVWDAWREQQEDAPKVVIFREGDLRTVRKPRQLGCGGHAEPGWRILQTVGTEDGEFFVHEICQICDYAAHGYEPDDDAGWPRHGNVPAATRRA